MWKVLIGVENFLPRNLLWNIMSTYRSVKTTFPKFSLLLRDAKVKVHLTLSTALTHYRDCRLGLLFYWFWNWVIDCGTVVNFMHRPPYPRGEKLVTLFMGSWVGPRFDFDSLVKVKESRNRPGVALSIPEGLGSQISWHLARKGGEVVSLTHRPPLPPEMFLVLIFTTGWVDPRAMVRSEGDMSLKNPVTPPGFNPGVVRLVAQRLNHYASPDPLALWRKVKPVCISPGIYPGLVATRRGSLTALLRARHVNCNGKNFRLLFLSGWKSWLCTEKTGCTAP